MLTGLRLGAAFVDGSQWDFWRLRVDGLRVDRYSWIVTRGSLRALGAKDNFVGQLGKLKSQAARMVGADGFSQV
jgi:hypothetical protein